MGTAGENRLATSLRLDAAPRKLDDAVEASRFSCQGGSSREAGNVGFVARQLPLSAVIPKKPPLPRAEVRRRGRKNHRDGEGEVPDLHRSTLGLRLSHVEPRQRTEPLSLVQDPLSRKESLNLDWKFRWSNPV